MKTDPRLDKPTAGTVCSTLRDMRRWGFSVVQAHTARLAPIEQQVDQARVVARQLLMVTDDIASSEVDDVARCLMDVATVALHHGGFVESEPRKRLACFDVPMLVRSPAPHSLSPDILLEMAIEACNDRTWTEDLQIVNVETVWQSSFLGFGRRPAALRVWHLAP